MIKKKGKGFGREGEVIYWRRASSAGLSEQEISGCLSCLHSTVDSQMVNSGFVISFDGNCFQCDIRSGTCKVSYHFCRIYISTE